MSVLCLRKAVFSVKVKELLKSTGWTANTLAEKTGISKPAIKSYMRGVREPSFTNASRVAKAFGKPMEYFL